MFIRLIPIILLSVLLAGCLGGPKRTTTIIEPPPTQLLVPDIFMAGCDITPISNTETISISEGLAAGVHVRKDACICALRYRDLIYYVSEQIIDPPSNAACPDLNEKSLKEKFKLKLPF